jgi:hypothetical protein
MSPPTDSAARSRALVVRSSGLDPDGRLVPMRSNLARWAESMPPGRPVPDAPTPTPGQIAKREALLTRWIETAQRNDALLRAIELV